jgi:hypothetical protein
MSYISSVVDPSGLSFRVTVSGPALPVDEEALKSGKAELDIESVFKMMDVSRRSN